MISRGSIFAKEDIMKAIYPLAIAAIVTAPVFASEMPKQGKYDYFSCWSGTNNVMPLPDKTEALAYDLTGSTRAVIPGGMFDKNTFHCIGASTMRDGKTIAGRTTCMAIDADGDKRVAIFANENGKETRHEVTGTGKYEGMEITDPVVENLGPLPVVKEGTAQGCNHQTGTYKLK
jgi:hypothetical protein